MTVVATGQSSTYVFSTNDSVLATLDPGAVGQIVIKTAAGPIVSKTISNTQVFGPFNSGDSMTLTAIRGNVAYIISSLEGFATPASLTADQLALGGTNAAVTPNGQLLDAQGNVIVPSAVRGASLGMWWTGLATNTQSALADRRANVVFTNNANGGSVVTMGASPAMQFNGKGFLQTSSTYFTALQRAIMRLDTLGFNDMIVGWLILTHPTTLSTNSLFYWGRNGDNGWGITIQGASGKLIFDHVPQGGSRDQHTLDISFGLAGDASTNSKSAIAWSVTRNTGDVANYGAGNGLFHVETSKQGLVDQGLFGQTNFSVQHPRRVPSGTAPASFSDAGLSIGGRPTTSASQVTDSMASGYGIDNMGFFRIKRRHALVLKLTRELQALYLAGTHQYTLPPSMTA